MDKVRDIFSYFVAAMTMFAFLGSVYQAFNGQVRIALTLGTLFVAGSVFVFLPMFEIFKMLGVEGHLRKTVTEAVATLDSLKKLSQISARSTYLNLAWGNRMGTPSAQEKQSVLDQIDAQLTELKVSEAERRAIQMPFVNMVRLDFYFLFTGALRQYAVLKTDRLVAAIHADPNSREAQAANIRHSESITAWTKEHNEPNSAEKLNRFTLEEVLNEYIPKRGEWLNDKDLVIIQKFKNEIIKLNADCEAKGGYTKGAAEYYDKYANDGSATRAVQLMNEAMRL